MLFVGGSSKDSSSAVTVHIGVIVGVVVAVVVLVVVVVILVVVVLCMRRSRHRLAATTNLILSFVNYKDL